MSDAAGRSQLVPEADLSGRQLGNYRLLRRLGRGAMAEVYLAEQISLRRQVAFKVLRSTLAKDESYVRRFHQEARAAASLIHANIVQIYEVDCIDGIWFIAQEYVRGWNLQEYLARRGTPDLKLAVRIMVQVAAALRKAAEQGIVHRDIKPENIMLAANGEVKVADFGLARLSGSNPGANLTQVGFTMGTPLYMSPEQVEGKPLDPRSDIYSFGVTAYHMLAGEPPFRGDTAIAVAVQHLNAQPPRIELVRPDLPPALCQMIHKMFAKSLDERYASARDLHRELRTLLQSGLPTAPVPRPPISPTVQTHTATVSQGRLEATQRLAVAMRSGAVPVVTPRRRRLLVGGIAAGIAGAFLLGVALAWATRDRPLLPQVADPVSQVPRKESPEAQFAYAQIANTEEGWKSVSFYFPNQSYLDARAKEQLARLYLQRGDLAEAARIFDEFAVSPDANLKAFGIAGQLFVAARQGNRKLAADKLGDLWPLRQHLDADMRARLARFIRQHSRAVGGKITGDWSEWLDLNKNPGNPPTAARNGQNGDSGPASPE